MANLQIKTRLGHADRFSAFCVYHATGLRLSDETKTEPLFEVLAS